MIHELKRQIDEINDYLLKVRMHLHMYPELGKEEYKTQAYIIDNLYKMGILDVKKSAGTGVVAFIEGDHPGKTIGLRAEIDALPIIDQKDVSYKSQVKGKMHASGHDAHIAILLGVAKIINDNKHSLSGNVKLFFQPAEETVGGASEMIDEGHLDDSYVDYVLGLHVDTSLLTGKIALKNGCVNASGDDFIIKVKGRASHAASSQQGADAILIASHIIGAIYSICSRNINSFDSVVINVGKITGGYASNVVAEEVMIEGTIRTLSTENRQTVITRLTEITESIPLAFGGIGLIDIVPSYTFLINDELITRKVRQNAISILGQENVEEIALPSMNLEDFAYFANQRPSCFFNLGAGDGQSKNNSHNGFFDIDMNALKLGVLLQVTNILNLLKEEI